MAWQRVFPGLTRPARAAWLMLDSPASFRLSSTGMDIGVVDLQHGLSNLNCMDAFTAVREAGASPFARLSSPTDVALAGRALDMGARGLIFPMCNTAEDARELVNMSKYPPQGTRSCGPRWGDAFLQRDDANDETVVFAMIETPSALKNVEDIVCVEGLDGLFIGPIDLELSLFGGKSEPEKREEAIAHVKTIAHGNGKRVGIYSSTGTEAASRAAEGFDLVTPFTDISGLISGAAAGLKSMEA